MISFDSIAMMVISLLSNLTSLVIREFAHSGGLSLHCSWTHWGEGREAKRVVPDGGIIRTGSDSKSRRSEVLDKPFILFRRIFIL